MVTPTYSPMDYYLWVDHSRHFLLTSLWIAWSVEHLNMVVVPPESSCGIVSSTKFFAFGLVLKRSRSYLHKNSKDTIKCKVRGNGFWALCKLSGYYGGFGTRWHDWRLSYCESLCLSEASHWHIDSSPFPPPPSQKLAMVHSAITPLLRLPPSYAAFEQEISAIEQVVKLNDPKVNVRKLIKRKSLWEILSSFSSYSKLLPQFINQLIFPPLRSPHHHGAELSPSLSHSSRS